MSLFCSSLTPAGAAYCRVSGILEGYGTAYFDAIKLVPRNSVKYTYDGVGNYALVSEDPLGKTNYSNYNNTTGTVKNVRDDLNNTTDYGYDNLNRLVQVTDPLTHNAYYGYDAVSNLTAIRDTRSASALDNTYATFFAPTNLNKLGTLTDPLNKNTIQTYDRSGNLLSIALPNGLALNFTYDNANRLTQKTLGIGKYFNYTYDGANNLTGVTDQNNQSYTWNYDGASRLISSTDTFGYTKSYQWDKSNNLTQTTGTNTGTVSYSYGSGNQLSMITSNFGGIYYNYDENGRLFQIRYPGNYNYRRNFYQANGWCTQIQDTGYPGQYRNVYSYYDNGTISGLSSWAGSETYTYDAVGRLTSWDFTPVNGTPIHENYVYDAAGNLTTKGSRTFSYNPLNGNANQITNVGFSYDYNGNLTSDGTNNYSYDAENRLTQVNKVSDNSLVATYTYNFDGKRKSKTVGGVTTNYDWDAFGNLVRESGINGNTLATYFYDIKGNIVCETNYTQGITYFYHTNLRGDIVSITDYNGNILAQYSYDPWGNQLSYSGTVTQPFRYAGYYYDDETGLYYLKSRYYSPQLGRFLTKDAYGYIDYKNPQTLNLYAYCNNNPVNNVDPDGNNPLIGMGAGALIGGGAAAFYSYYNTGSVDWGLVLDWGVNGALIGCGVGELVAGRLALKGAGKSLSGYGAKSESYLTKRGWTWDSAQDVVGNPYTTREAVNKATGNSAKVFYNKAGDYVVRDNITGELVQTSKFGDVNWIPDSSIINPYKP